MNPENTRKKTDFDVVIIGAGPAGLSAAIWCADLGMSAIVLEKEPEPGGQLLQIYNPITNYPGLAVENGRILRDRFMESFNRCKVPIILSAEVVHLDSENTSVTMADGRTFSAKSIILATGVRRRKLDIPGEEEFQGKGILESGSRDKHLVKGKTVAIIGGGDAALENALILADYAEKVYVIHRRKEFRAREEFVNEASANPKVEFFLGAVATKILGNDLIESLEIEPQDTSTAQMLPVDAILIRIGVEPNNRLLSAKVDLDPQGYIQTSTDAQTRIANIYVAGDVANPISPTITTAAGTASIAVKSALNSHNSQKSV